MWGLCEGSCLQRSERQKRVSDALELEPLMLVSCTCGCWELNLGLHKSSPGS